MSKRSRFDLIAPLYSLFFKYQVKTFTDVLAGSTDLINGKQDSQRVLDIGCGTGALLYVLARDGHQCTGVDPSGTMLSYAAKNLDGLEVRLYRENPVDPALFKEEQFDFVFITHVLHGLVKEKRMELLKRAYALAVKKVVIIDYLKRGSLATDFIEWLEGGDYFRFVKEFRAELQSVTDNFQILPGKKSGGIFIINK